MDRFVAGRILGAVDETDHRAHVEVAEAVHFVLGRHRAVELLHELRGEFEAEVGFVGANVQQDVARRGDGHALALAEFAERVQFGGTRLAEQRVPCVGRKADHAREVAGGHAFADGAHEIADVRAPGAHGGAAGGILVDGQDDEKRAAGDGAGDGLRFLRE